MSGHVQKPQWYRCKGCGAECGVFVDPKDGQRKIAHVKPMTLLGVPNSVPCALYRRCETFDFFFREMAGEPIEAPESMTPAEN